MFMRTTSIRGKIAAGFVLSFSFLLLVASVMFVSLLVIEDDVGLYSGISRYLDATLEMRRYEKNFLLYGKPEDLEKALEYAGSVRALFADGAMGGGAGTTRYPRWLRFLVDVDTEEEPTDFNPERTSQLLADYEALLRRAGGEKPSGAAEWLALEAGIRDLGRRITDVAERLSAVGGRNIQEMLRAGRRILILLVAVFLLGTALIARVIVLTAIRPLKELETGMQRIASGDWRALPEGPAHDEIGSMNAAFNRMIREVFEHRQEILQSERLASLGTALAGIAHEINNPLSNISTSAEILREENETAGPRERHELIEQIVSQTDRATDIIRTVLDFTRETRFDRRATNLLSAIRGSLILVRGDMPAHVAVEVDVAPDLEVLADKTRLEQAFINLMTNAIDAMSDPGRAARITVSARPAGEGDVEIVFRDTGVGIPRHLVDKVFDPFFTTKDVGRGTGLGLYLTHQIVEQHGGTVHVESTVGEGTTVVITLPRREPRRAAPGEAVGKEGRG
jgi:signal transduction histidine kinase